MDSHDKGRPREKRPSASNRSSQDGMALILAILVILVLTVIGAALMANVNTESKITGLKLRNAQAMQLAEAGVQEAMLRIRNGDVVDDLVPNDTTFIFNQPAGSVPSPGTGNTALATLQPTGAYLSYSTTSKSPSTLQMNYKTRNGVILRYDDTANPKINTASGNPIWCIRSTGTQNGVTDSVYAEVCRQKVVVLAKGAVVAKVGIQFKGNINVCGHDHRSTTPVTAQPGGGGGKPDCDAYWTGTVHTSCMPGAWSQSTITQQGSPTLQGEPSGAQANMTGFYSGPWDVFSMTQNDFWSWIGPPTNIPPANPVGIIYLDNNAIKSDAIGNWTYNGGTGEGFLYCDGDLQLNGNFVYKGMIYVEGDLTINGNVWILGGLVVKGKSTVHIANGSAVVLYSGDTISQKVSKYGGNVRTIAWREF